MKFYREPSGDYLVIWPENGHGMILDSQGFQRTYQGRTAKVPGLVSSVCASTVFVRHLATCEEVAPSDVPPHWMEWLAADDGDEAEIACEV